MRKIVIGRRRIQQLAKQDATSFLQRNIQPKDPIPKKQEASNNGNISDAIEINEVNWSFEETRYPQVESSIELKNVEDCKSEDLSLISQLRQWAVSSAVNHKQFSSLLKLLKTHECFKDFPSDSRTVLAIQKVPEIVNLHPGEYVHFGLTELIQPCINSNIKSLPLQINVDGLPLFKSSGKDLWPVLGQFVGINTEPFVIGAFCGRKKPTSVNDFLAPFVNEFNELKASLSKNNINLFIHSIVCDAPAKAYIKCIKGHTGYFGCDKCNVEGTHISNRMAFTNLDATRRDNESFRHRRDIEHHLADTVLENILDLDMVECFPMDYMHLICLGVMRKLLNIWMKGKPGEHKISGQQINALSEKLISLSGETASEFARKPRSQFVFCAVNSYIVNFIRMHSLLKYFVEGFQTLYGSELVSYNVHGLIHLATDSQKLGVLETFSAFKFENKLQQIKKYVRTPNKPLQQIVHRILESGSNVCKLKSDIKRNWNLSQPHECGPVIDLFNGKQYILLDLNDFQSNEVFLLGSVYSKKYPVFLEPCNSTILDIYYFDKVHSEQIVRLTVSDLKYYKMYFIMEIKDEGGETCEIIPESWFFPEEEECAWPPVKNVSKYVEKKRSPEANWKRYPARKIHVYDTYKAARENLHRAEMTSDLNSEVDETPKRKRRIASRNICYTQKTDDSDIDSRQKVTKLKTVPSLPVSIPVSSVEIARLKNRRTVQNPPQHGSQLGSSPMNFSTLENIV
ncbi:hypothetical protein Ocin01_17924, partial [Orchesella cincta]